MQLLIFYVIESFIKQPTYFISSTHLHLDTTQTLPETPISNGLIIVQNQQTSLILKLHPR